LSRLPGKRARPVLRGPRRSNAPGLLDETFFGLLTRQALRWGSFASVPDLVAAIGWYIAAWDADCHPFCWVKDADQILVKAASRSQPARPA
jgi:hypothetical protein